LLAVVSLAAPLSRHVAHAQHQAATPVPLESLRLIQSTNVVVIPPGNSANFQGQPIGHGLQMQSQDTESAEVLFSLGKHYTRLSGTAYVDDSSNTDGIANKPDLQIFDESSISPNGTGEYDVTGGRVLLNYTFTSGVTSTTFTIDVSNVNLIWVCFIRVERRGSGHGLNTAR